MLFLITISGCLATKTTYIEILEPDRAFYFGNIAFTAEPGDTLKLLSSELCGTSAEAISTRALKQKRNKTCWEVWHIDKNKVGYVLKERMEERHKIYQKDE